MGLFKKLGRGIKRIAKKNQGGFRRLVKKVGPAIVLSAVPGGAPALIAKAASAAKTLGKKFKGIETPKSIVPVVRAAQVAVTKTRSKLPGGAPMPSMMSSRPQAKRRITLRPARMTSTGVAYQTPADMKGGLTRAQLTGNTGFGRPKKAKRRITKPPSAKQLAQRERFKAMAAARRKGA